MDQSIIRTKLQRVFTLDPGEVIHEVVHGHIQQRGGVFRSQRADSHKI